MTKKACKTCGTHFRPFLWNPLQNVIRLTKFQRQRWISPTHAAATLKLFVPISSSKEIYFGHIVQWNNRPQKKLIASKQCNILKSRLPKIPQNKTQLLPSISECGTGSQFFECTLLAPARRVAKLQFTGCGWKKKTKQKQNKKRSLRVRS